MKKEKSLLIWLLLLCFPTPFTFSKEGSLPSPNKQQGVKVLLLPLPAEEAKSTDASPSTPPSLDKQPPPEGNSAVPP